MKSLKYVKTFHWTCHSPCCLYIIWWFDDLARIMTCHLVWPQYSTPLLSALQDHKLPYWISLDRDNMIPSLLIVPFRLPNFFHSWQNFWRKVNDRWWCIKINSVVHWLNGHTANFYEERINKLLPCFNKFLRPSFICITHLE